MQEIKHAQRKRNMASLPSRASNRILDQKMECAKWFSETRILIPWKSTSMMGWLRKNKTVSVRSFLSDTKIPPKTLKHLENIQHIPKVSQKVSQKYTPSNYPLRVGGWNFVEKQGVPPKKGLYKMKSLGGHPTTKSEHRQTYVGTNFQEISRNPGLQNQNLAVRKSSCFFMFFTFASKMHIDVKWGWFCREVIL